MTTSPLHAVTQELSILIRIGKEDGGVYLEKFGKILPLILDSEEGDDFDYKKMTLDILPNFLQLLPRITTQRAEVEEMVLNVICQLMSVMALRQTDNSTSFLLHLCTSCLIYIPDVQAHKRIITKLCEYILPMTIFYSHSSQEDPLSFLPIPTVLHTVLDCCNQDMLHVQVTDTLMWLKRDVCSDLLTVIAMGTEKVRLRAVKLLCRYWLGGLRDYGTSSRSRGPEWVPPACDHCQGDGNEDCSAAALVCLDAQCASQHCNPSQKGKTLYLYLCKSCNRKIHGDHSNHMTVRYPQPLRDFKVNCEFQRSCLGPGAINQAVVTCYHSSCTTIQRGQPVRMCQACHESNHDGLQDDRHIYQAGPVNPWEVGVRRNQLSEVFSAKALLEALSKLLESRPAVSGGTQAGSSKSNTHTQHSYHFSYSREAIVMLTTFCTPKAHISEGRQYWLTRFMAHSLEWLLAVYKMVETHSAEDTSFFDHLSGHNLWTDITQHLVPWLQVVHSLYPRMMMDCLVPNRVPAAQVQDYTTEAEECLHALWKLYTLSWSKLAVFKEPSSYHEVFCTVVTGWMSTLCSPSNRGKWEGLDGVLCALFHSQEVHDELFPLYYFVKQKISEGDSVALNSALEWLQELTSAGVVIPYLRHFFERIMSEGEEVDMAPHLLSVSGLGNLDFPDDTLSTRSPVSRFILMLDVVLAQLQLRPKSSSQLHQIQHTLDYDSLVSLMLNMLNRQGVWEGPHTGDHHDSSNPCSLCQGYALWFSMASQVVQDYQASLRGRMSASVSDEQDITHHAQTSDTSGMSTLKRIKARFASSTTPPPGDPGFPERESVPTGIVTNKVSVASSTGSSVTFHFPEDFSQSQSQGGVGGRLDAIIESQRLESPPPEHQRHSLCRQSSVYDPTITYKLFQKATQMLRLKGKNRLHPNAIYQLVDFLDTFVLRVGILEVKEASPETMFKDVRGLFFKLWEGLQSDNGFLSQKIFPLFTRTVRFLSPTISQDQLDSSLSKALEKFWSKLDEESFQSSDWKVRFHSAEKVMLLGHFITSDSSVAEELFLAYCFCNLIGLMMDSKMEVSVRARYCIENTGKAGLQSMVMCCVEMFNRMPSQQSRVLKALASLHSTYPQLGVVTYEEVIQRFQIYQRLWGEHGNTARKQSLGIGTKQKLSKQSSDGSKETHGAGRGVTMRQLKEDIAVIQQNSECLYQVLTLLLQILTNPATCPSVSEKETEASAGDLARRFELILCHGPDFIVKVNELRESQLLDLFLFQMYQVLDSNTVFSQNSSLLSFLLRLLVFIVLPREEDFQPLVDMTLNRQPLHVGLELLEDTACQNWLKLFFIICYKYGGVLQSADNVDTLLPWVMACMEVVLNTVNAHAHECFPGEVPKETTDELTDSFHTSVNEERAPSKKSMSKQTSFGALGMSADGGRSPKKGRLLSLADTHAVAVEQKAMEEAFVLRCKSIALQRRPIVENEVCPLCYRPKQYYPEKNITLCVVAMGTFANRFPTRVARYLKSVTIAMARVIIPGSYPWQDLKLAGSKPGSAISVAKQFLVCLLSQFGERNLFQHLFGWSLSDEGHNLLPAIIASLPPCEDEGEDQDVRTGAEAGIITQVTPVELFIKDCLAASHLHTVLTEMSLMNLAHYLSLLRDVSAKRDLLKITPLLDQLLKRLTRPNLQDLLTRDDVWVSIVQVIVLFIQAFKDYRDERIRTKFQEPSEEEGVSISTLLCLSPHITELLEQGFLRCGKVTLYSILSLLASWYEAFSVEQKPREQEKFLRLLASHHLPVAIRLNSPYLRNSKLVLIQFALLAQGGLYGYLEDFSGQRLHTRELRLNDQFHLCIEKFAQLQVNLEAAIQLLGSLEVKDPVLKLSVAELLLLNFDSYSPHSPLQRLRNLIRFPDRSSLDTSTIKGSNTACTILPQVQVLANLTWLILASMRGWAAGEATDSDPLTTTSLGVQRHTSTLVIHLLDHSSPDSFVQQVAVFVREAITRLKAQGTEEEIKTVFVFIQVWIVYLELVQNNLVIDIVSYLIEDLWQKIIDEVDKVPDDAPISYHFHKCVACLKQANVTTLPALEDVDDKTETAQTISLGRPKPSGHLTIG